MFCVLSKLINALMEDKCMHLKANCPRNSKIELIFHTGLSYKNSLTVLIHNSRTAWSTKNLKAILSPLYNWLWDAYTLFQKGFNNFELKQKNILNFSTPNLYQFRKRWSQSVLDFLFHSDFYFYKKKASLWSIL